ncbi:MAG: alpha/beta hydrolase, partial [Mesorhizobium sp.]
EFTGDRQLAEAPVPTLIIHAPDDREVHADHARRYAGAGEHVHLHWADGLGHRRILADRNVVARAVGFVTEQREAILH